MATNLKFRIFIIILYTKIKISARIYINWLRVGRAVTCTVVFINYFIFKALINLSVTTVVPSLRVEYISISISCNHNFIDLLQISRPLSTHALFGLQLDSYNICWKALVIVTPFLLSTYTYLL